MEQAEQLRLEGVIESIIFHSEETGFTVMEVAVDDELVTVVGESMELSPGEEIAATGTFTAHPSYGRQFKASCFERVMPATAAAMLRYLSGRGGPRNRPCAGAENRRQIRGPLP